MELGLERTVSPDDSIKKTVVSILVLMELGLEPTYTWYDDHYYMKFLSLF